MSEVQSDLFVAREKATALKNATETLRQNISIALDNKTTVAGNQRAHEVIESSKKTTSAIAQAIASASDNLKSVAEDFAAMDQETQNLFKSPLGGIK